MEHNKEPRNGPTQTCPVDFDKSGEEAIQWRKGRLCNKWCWSNRKSTGKKRNTNLNCTLYKMDHGLKRKMENFETFYQKKIGDNCQDLGLDKGVLRLTPKAGSIKGKIDNLELFKAKNVCSVKACMKVIKRQAMDQQKTLTNPHPTKD